MGVRCKYDGGDNYSPWVAALAKKFFLIPVCPEQLGGLPTPRLPSEIRGGDGADVLNGYATVVDRRGRDVSKFFVAGAEEIRRLTRLLPVSGAILKSRSPSCGTGCIYDGSFTGTCRAGDGVAAAVLRAEGINLYCEKNLPTSGEI